MNVLITAPSLNESENVSGMSTLVNTIINNNETDCKYFHFAVGIKDNEVRSVKWVKEQISLLPRLGKFVKANRIDLVHLNTAFTKASILREFIILFFLKKITKKPVLLHIHGGYMLMNPPKKNSPYSRLITYILGNSDLNIVLSHIEQKQLYTNFNFESQVLPNVVPLPTFKQKNKDFEGKIRFIFLGRIVNSKGIYMIAESLKKLSTYHNEFSFTMYGTGPELPDLLKQLEGIKTLNFSYKGIAKNDEKWNAFDEANVFLLPSIFGEGLPIAMLEAMQFGCVPVVSNDASISTVVKNLVNGLLITKGNQFELDSALEWILNNKNGLTQISEEAKDTILKNYNSSNYVKKLLSFYLSIINH